MPQSDPSEAASGKETSPDERKPSRPGAPRRSHLLREFLVAPGDKLAYEYDFGHSWRHTVLLEEVLEPAEAGGATARCIAGSRACPPEDCGGIQSGALRRTSAPRARVR
jgi:hypothetical protein